VRKWKILIFNFSSFFMQSGINFMIMISNRTGGEKKWVINSSIFILLKLISISIIRSLELLGNLVLFCDTIFCASFIGGWDERCCNFNLWNSWCGFFGNGWLLRNKSCWRLAVLLDSMGFVLGHSMLCYYSMVFLTENSDELLLGRIERPILRKVIGRAGFTLFLALGCSLPRAWG
jgi:hypothetical protein